MTTTTTTTTSPSSLPQISPPPVAREVILSHLNNSSYVRAVRNNTNASKLPAWVKNTVDVLFFLFVMAMCVGCVMLLIANLVFAVQGLVIGRRYYDSPDSCNAVMGTWMLVYGSLSISAFLLSCCGKSTASNNNNNDDDADDGNPKRKRTFAGALFTLTSLVNMCWVCYGFSLASSSAAATVAPGSLPACDPASLWDSFYLMTYFLFYGSIALFGATLLGSCVFITYFAKYGDKLQSGEARGPFRDNPDLPKASIVLMRGGANGSIEGDGVIAEPEVYLAEVEEGAGRVPVATAVERNQGGTSGVGDGVRGGVVAMS